MVLFIHYVTTEIGNKLNPEHFPAKGAAYVYSNNVLKLVSSKEGAWYWVFLQSAYVHSLSEWSLEGFIHTLYKWI